MWESYITRRVITIRAVMSYAKLRVAAALLSLLKDSVDVSYRVYAKRKFQHFRPFSRHVCIRAETHLVFNVPPDPGKDSHSPSVQPGAIKDSTFFGISPHPTTPPQKKIAKDEIPHEVMRT